MTDNHKNFISKLNSFHIIILGCTLGCILILNSNNVNRQKEITKLNQEKSALFDKIISKRRLNEETVGEDDEYIYETDEVCSRASDKLQDYYKTGDLSKIDLDNSAIECEDKDSDYMKALIDLFESFVEDDEDGDNNDRLRNLLDKETEDSIKDYGYRVLPMLIFLCVSVLSIIGWIICCFTCCFNCCCCCCCKGSTFCKIFWFIFSFLFYALVVAVCIYGLTQTSKIFTGIADTECSLLQFFDVILFGEKKQTTPKWIGVENVNILLNRMHTQLDNMANADLLGNLDLLMEEIDFQKGLFKSELESSYQKFYDPDSPTTYLSQYTQEYSSGQNYYIGESSNKKNLVGKYVLDIIKKFGKYDSTSKTFEENTFLSFWNTEFSGIGEQAGTTLTQARNNFNEILTEKLGDIRDALEKGQDELSKLRDPFNDVYNDISEYLYDASDTLDKNGKLSVNLVFGVLGFMNLALGVLMFFICMFSTQTCAECTFFRGIFKFVFHILWNLLALCMVLSFMIGSALALIGRVGADMMSFVSYVVSEENFNAGNNAVLLNKLKDGKKILEKCIIGNGDLAEEFGLDSMANDFNSINEAQTEIRGYLNDFQEIKESYPAYYASKQALENRTEFIDDTYLVHTGTPGTGTAESVSLKEVINKLNSALDTSINEKWDQKDGDKEFECLEGNGNDNDVSDNHPLNNLLHPWTCEPYHRDWVLSSTNEKVKNYAKIATDIIDILKNANGTNSVQKNYYDVLDDLKDKYTPYLQTYLDVLGFFDEVIGNLINMLEEGIGNSNDTFSFLNGKFIQTNLKVILKYLKYSLGQDVYTVGICLIIVGCSLVLSISSTLLLSALINEELEKNKKMEPQTEIKEYPQDNEGRVIEYKY